MRKGEKKIQGANTNFTVSNTGVGQFYKCTDIWLSLQKGHFDN